MTPILGRFEPVVAIFNLSTTEMIIVVVVLILLFGANKIPKLMRSLGRAQGEFNRAKKEFDKEVKAAEMAEPEDAKAGTTVAPTGVAPAAKDPLEAARKRARALGIDTEGKDLDTLKKEIGEKVIAGDAA